MGKNTRLHLVFSPTLLSCSTASCVLYNRTEHSRGFIINKVQFSSVQFITGPHIGEWAGVGVTVPPVSESFEISMQNTDDLNKSTLEKTF